MSTTSLSTPVPANASKAAWLASLPPPERQSFLATLTDREALALEYDWGFWARPNQLPPPGDWLTWLLQSGRGSGKTRVGAEWVRSEVEAGHARRVALVAETAADARDVMVEGESGILNISPPWNRPNYEPSKRRLTWPNGAIAICYSADDPEQLRGHNSDLAWGDEIGKWHSARKRDGSITRAESAWANLMFGLRLGRNARCVATSTPRPTPLMRMLVADPATVITRGTTYDNLPNLSPVFARTIARYEGTRLGRQELQGELLEDVEGALWTFAMIEAARWKPQWGDVPELSRIVIAIDPAGGSGEENDETGIGAAGKGLCKCTGEPEEHFFVLSDLSGRYTPDGWARRAISEYYRIKADRVVAEGNFGGEMVEHTLRTVDPSVSYKAVHASRGKQVRAEPVAALFEQGKVHMVGLFPELEDQLCNWVPGDAYSPDRMDWMVWACTELATSPAPAMAGVDRAPFDSRPHMMSRGRR